MKKPGWKMGSVIALLMCTSLSFSGLAAAATKDLPYQQNKNHQTLGEQSTNTKTSGDETPDVTISTMDATSTQASATANASSAGAQVIKAGEKYMGIPYEYGSSRSDKSTMDCSEFTMWAFREGAGIDLGRGGARSQYKKVKPISRNDLQVGDLVFFSTKATMKYSASSIKRIGHIGIYAGNNKILHTYGKGGVTYSNLSGWWDKHFVAAGRVLN